MEIIAAVPTPSLISEKTILHQIELLYHQTSIRKVFLCGTTGESLLLTLEERKNILELWSKIIISNDYDIDIVLHIGTENIKYTNQLAEHAENFNCVKAVSAMAPSFFKPSSLEKLAEYINNIKTSKPFYYYHLPDMTGINFKMIDLLKNHKFNNLKGIKFTGTDLDDLYECTQCTEYEIYYGRDEWMPYVLQLPLKGFIGSSYNLSEMMKTVYGPMLERRQATLLEICKLQNFMSEYKKIGAIKYLKMALGLDYIQNDKKNE